MQNKIELLTQHDICDCNGNCYGIENPSNYELMEKINEIINYINAMEGDNECIQMT